MKRVHDYDMSKDARFSKDYKEDKSGSSDALRKRKGSSASSSSNSVQMKRTSSSQAKANAASISYSRDGRSTYTTEDPAYQYAMMQQFQDMSMYQGDTYYQPY